MLGYRSLIQAEKPHQSSPLGKSTKKVLGLVVSLRYVLAIGGLLFLAMLSYRHDKDGRKPELVYISCTSTQPLVRVYPNFLPKETFQVMHKELPNHPLIGGNQLDEDNFAGSKGFLVKFNLEGMKKLRANKMFSNLMPYIDSVLSPQSNAFVFNLLVSVPGEPGKLAVGVHLDDTVAFYDMGEDETHLAHQVNVLYTNLPQEMQGGQLEAWHMDYEDADYGRAVVRPTENTMVQFRGDAYHRVQGFSSPSGANRISLVFEQYRVSSEDYNRTIAYCENQQCAQLESMSPDELPNMTR